MSPLPLGILALSGAGAAGAYDLLETQILTSTAASVEFTGLGSYSDYKHLQIRAVVQSTWPVDAMINCNIRVNSDSGSNYAQHYLLGDGSSVTSSFRTSSDSVTLDESVVASSGDAFAAFITDILDFANTNKYKTFRTLAGGNTDDSDISLQSGLWMNTNAITSLEITPQQSPTYGFAVGSRLSLYGIRG
jgi:hypothetical protein